MRLKRDYMGNDQLLPAYNLQTAICDEYIAVIDVKPYASDMECFVPLVENSIVHMVIIRNIRLPMQDTVLTIIIFIVKNTAWKKYMKFTMYKKETTDKNIVKIHIVL